MGLPRTLRLLREAFFCKPHFYHIHKVCNGVNALITGKIKFCRNNAGFVGMELKGIKKRFKEKAFAAAVNRDEILEAMQMAGVELETIMQFIIERQREVK